MRVARRAGAAGTVVDVGVLLYYVAVLLRLVLGDYCTVVPVLLQLGY